MLKLMNLLVFFGLLLVGCPSDPGEEALPPLPPMDLPEGCNPLTVQEDCLLPFPSDYFLKDDSSMPSKKSVALTNYATPYDEWTETVIHAEDSLIQVLNHDGKMYTYKKFRAFSSMQEKP